MSKKSNYTQELEIIRNEISRKKIKYTVPSLMPDIERIKLHLEIEVLERIAKKLEALEIIKNKKVDIFHINGASTFKEYNDNLFVIAEKITQEEYTLLKEVLDNA